MKITHFILPLAIALIVPLPCPAAANSAGVSRNLDWALVTLDKVEKDLADISTDATPADAQALPAAFESARRRLSNLKSKAKSGQADPEMASSVVDFTRDVSNLAQTVMDHINDRDQKGDSFQKLLDENGALEKTDVKMRFDEIVKSLTSDIVSNAALQLADKPGEAAESDGAWALDVLRADQLSEEAVEESEYLNQRKELEENMREAGKNISLAPFDQAREKLRAAKRRQRDLAVDKQNISNRINAANVQLQLLDQKAGNLNDAVDLARQAAEEARDEIQQRIDDN